MRKPALIIITAALGACLSLPLPAQTPAPRQDESSDAAAPRVTADLSLDPVRRRELEEAIGRRDYRRAEMILVEEVERDPKSPRAARLLVMAAGLFFLDGQYLNAAIAYKKAEAIMPPGALDERSRFTLAMAYVKLNRPDWARAELDKLAAARPGNALYPYWLARLDYGAQEYPRAIARFKEVIRLDPKMMRAYDGLGLCYDYLGRYTEAIDSFSRAVELNRQQAQPSPWPHVNLAVSLAAVGRLSEAEAHLREALRNDAKLPQAHYQLGQLLERQGKYPEAIQSLTQAVALDSTYPEPHYLLGRIHQRQGDREQAKKFIERFQQLKEARNAQPAGSSARPR